MAGPAELQRGLALHRAGDFAGAAHAYEAVLAGDPGHPDALHLLGLIAHRHGRHAEARALIERALARDPDNPLFLANLGNVAKDAGDVGFAAAAYRRSLAADPRMTSARNNLGTLLLAAGDVEQAIECFRAVVAQQPDHARAWFNLGTALGRRHDLRGAVDALRRAVALDRHFAEAWSELGIALGAVGEHGAAVQALRTRVATGASPTALADLALALHRAGDLVAARDAYEAALSLDAAALPVRCNLLALLQKLCDWDGVDRHWPLVRSAIEAGQAGVPSGLLIAQPGASAALQLAVARANATLRTRNAAPTTPPLIDGSRRLRLGFLSADFREHATAYLVTEVFELLDRARFEVVLLSYGTDDSSEARRRLQRAADRFVDLRDADDATAARRIGDLGIDVLVDLNGDTDNGRMGIAALRPAPVAVSWLGFPGTLGRDCYDFLLADAQVVPAGEERWYDETVVRLADCYQCNDRRRPRPPAAARADLGFAERAVVLCCFNQSFKITRDVFDVWLRILDTVPDTVLWLLEDNRAATEALRGRAAAAGIEPGRVGFAPRRPLADHLARYLVADLALDTFPCTSHTTASDALWMGCPLVTREGDTFAGRVATSLLRTLGLDELVTADLASYESVIRGLARDPRARADLRARLSRAAEASPLFDSPRFARALGAALLDIADRAARGQVPAGPA